MIKQVILDMGNVLMDYNPEVPLERFCQTEEEREAIRRELFGGPEWVQSDLGLLSDEGMYERVKARLPGRFHPALKRCVEGWDICMKPLPGAKEFCDACRAEGYGLYLLSNASGRFYHYFPRFAPLSDFDGLVISSDVHLVKPDVRIYRYLLEQYGLAGEESLFLDDREDNVQGARRAGMQAAVFRGDFNRIAEEYGLFSR